jgi:16S rRNA (guanine527-N7)-methyltransferase
MMNSHEFQSQLARRALVADVDLSPVIGEQLEAYYRLLAHWNAIVNLTALPLNPITDQAVDRLLIEPLTAARCVLMEFPIWFDIGSGGGSPAIPLKFAKPGARLTMVESKERKAAFLREAVRALGIENTSVETVRIEEVATNPRVAGIADLITVRAVKVNPTLLASIKTLLRGGGQTLLFGAKRAEFGILKGFEVLQNTNSPEAENLNFVVLNRVDL